MNYEFPTIERIEDVLPAIEGRDEFIVAEREGYKVINYNVGFEDTFTIDENDVMENYGRMIPKGVMRRECRGIIFDAEGNLISRPFHKFFNIGEREETQLHNIDLSQPHVIMEKMDGSMIRPIRFFDENDVEVIRLGTKMGVTDTALAADEYLQTLSQGDRYARAYFMIQMVRQGMTPLFEFVSPDNRIVIEYAEADLVLLAIRENRSGRYLEIDEMRKLARDSGFTIVPTYGSVEGSLDEYIARQRGREGREGDIIRVGPNFYKVKNDWYVRIHKVKDKIRSDRHILALLLENELDDLYPHLDERDYNRVKAYESDFHVAVHAKIGEIEYAARDAWLAANFNKKALATEVLPRSNIRKDDWQIVFKYADGNDNFVEMVMARVRSKLGNTAKYNEMADWLGISGDNGEVNE